MESWAACRMLVHSETTGGKEDRLKEMVSSDKDLAELLTDLQDHHWWAPALPQTLVPCTADWDKCGPA